MNIPVYIICRDRVTYLRSLVEWLEQADGVSAIIMVDNASTYGPLLEFYEETPHRVIRHTHNRGPWGAWDTIASYLTTPYFALTDCDVLPREDCPRDLIPHLCNVLDENSLLRAAMAGLDLTDVPTTSLYGARVLGNERMFWSEDRRIGSAWFLAPVDTTLTVFRHGAQLCMRRDWNVSESEPARTTPPSFRMTPWTERRVRLDVWPLDATVGRHPAYSTLRDLPAGVVDMLEWTNRTFDDWCAQMVRGRSVRSGFPYVVRHLDWYLDGPLDAESEFYLSRAHPHYAGWLRLYMQLRDRDDDGSVE